MNDKTTSAEQCIINTIKEQCFTLIKAMQEPFGHQPLHHITLTEYIGALSQCEQALQRVLDDVRAIMKKVI